MRDATAWSNWCNVTMYFGSKLNQDWGFHFEHVCTGQQQVPSGSQYDAVEADDQSTESTAAGRAPLSQLPWPPTPPAVPPPGHDMPGQPAEIPEWFTFTKDITVWHHTLAAYGVDEDAMAKLVRLAAWNDDGWEHANDIMDQLIHKATSGTMTNPSGFIYSNAAKARWAIKDKNNFESKGSKGGAKGSKCDSKGSKGDVKGWKGAKGRAMADEANQFGQSNLKRHRHDEHDASWQDRKQARVNRGTLDAMLK